jgi:hypothetical protein
MEMTIYTITQKDLDENKPWRYPGVTEPGRYTWSETHYSYYPVQQNGPTDFDSGLGIGGLGRHEEKPIVPIATQVERMEKAQARARICRRCGQSDVFDGAMFTTGGGNVCDDCF